MNPAYLSGRLELDLHESTHIKEINMTLACKAKVQFTDIQGSVNFRSHDPKSISSLWWKSSKERTCEAAGDEGTRLKGLDVFDTSNRHAVSPISGLC